MKLTIHITKEVLRESMYCQSKDSLGLWLTQKQSGVGQNCAIGKAIYKLFGNRSWVGLDWIIFDPVQIRFSPVGNVIDEGTISIELPPEATDFIQTFDNMSPFRRMQIEPFFFTIEVPEEVINLIGIDEVHKVLKESKTMSLAV